jgi:hypothetical protein
MPEAAMQAAWLKMVRHVMANTEDVGERFAEEARKIHYGETEERGIRGQASREETEALLDEGIGVLPLPAERCPRGRCSRARDKLGTRGCSSGHIT